MRELKVALTFTTECLGNVKYQPEGETWPAYRFARTPDGNIRFEASWWRSNIRFAADVLCRHHKAVEQVHFDVAVARAQPTKMYRRYFNNKAYMRHEAFLPGDRIIIKCLVPDSISDEDFKQLMDLIGRFRGISPFGPREYGFFTVTSVQLSVGQPNEGEDIQRRAAVEDSPDNAASGNDTYGASAIHAAQSLDD